jgi:poly-gamma-glutamate capsule biosynthesis protein CapA/YwtB (metallophosphatase superfamily)
MNQPPGNHGKAASLLPALVLTISLALALGGPARLKSGTSDGSIELDAYPWLYLRDGEPLADEEVIEVIAVGDVMAGRGVADVMLSQGAAQPFAKVAPWLRTADVTFGNLESVIAEGGIPRPGPYRLRAPLVAAAALRDAGFDVLGLANNHALDFGPAALAETVSRLRETGVATVGAGPDANAAAQPLMVETDGLQLAFMALNVVPDPDDVDDEYGWTRAAWDREQVVDAVASARAHADAVLVSIHWGYEYELRPDPAQRDIAQAILNAGADGPSPVADVLVIGHHPHVVQGTQAGPGGFVAYSLGNFLFDQEQGETRQGLALRIFFDAQGLRAVQALPVWAGSRPRLMRPDEALPLLARVATPIASHRSPDDSVPTEPTPGESASGTPPRIGFTCSSLETDAGTSMSGNPGAAGNPESSCRPVEVPQMSQVGPFRGGAIDLTGDGVPEGVRLEGEQLVIEDGNGETWRGLPEWRVVDVALGDPNDDGRGELLLALWKPDAESVPRSHPFIVGFREGAYRVLWGGSAVVDPIHKVELGDVDADGKQELVVLEDLSGFGNPNGLRTVTVWDWHGWGFSLAWRSPPGRYHDLALLPGAGASPPTISVAVAP